MAQRTKIYVLVGLLVVAAAVCVHEFGHSSVPGFSGVLAADTTFQPLDVQEPSLRLAELDRVRKLEYSGSHRNIFVAAPPPPPPSAVPVAPPKPVGDLYPLTPPPQPPPTVPAQFFGYASQPGSGKRVAFFTSGDDVLVVAEGDKFLNTFRLVHIGNESADVEEIASGRHATVPLVQPPPEPGGGLNQNP